MLFSVYPTMMNVMENETALIVERKDTFPKKIKRFNSKEKKVITMKNSKQIFMAMALAGGIFFNMAGTTHASTPQDATYDNTGIYHPVKLGQFDSAREAENTGLFAEKAGVVPVYHPVKNGQYNSAEEATNTGIFAGKAEVTSIYHPVKNGSYNSAEEAVNTGIFVNK